jgi:hypothetical protein
VEAGPGEPFEGAEPGVRGGGAGLDAPDQPPLEGGERDVDADGVPLGELDQEVGVPGDERRLGDDAEVEPAGSDSAPARDPEAALGRLVGSVAVPIIKCTPPALRNGCASAPRRRWSDQICFERQPG